ncbi:unnamed protein product [Pedinophyceae sp. YPF-701]|nr:unnamed protein product [Pedinophyceae sp. YPF-701]
MAARLCANPALAGKASSFTGSRVQSARLSVPQTGRGALQTRMARVGGVEIPNPKRIQTSLTYIYGIGPTTAASIMSATGLENKRTHELSEDELQLLRNEVDQYMTEGDLRRFNGLNIKRLIEIQCYRGKRHQSGLPLRGQRTKTNARTRKGRRKTVAGKKIAKK